MTLSSCQSGFLRLEVWCRRKRLEGRLGRRDELNQVRVERKLFRNSAVTSAYSTAFDLKYDTYSVYTCWESQEIRAPESLRFSISVLGGPEGGSYHCDYVCSFYGKCNLGSSVTISYQPYIFFPIGQSVG